MKYPEGGIVNIQSLAEKDASKLPHFHGIIKDISILGFDEKPSWNRTEDGLEITTDHISSDKPVVFKLLID